MSSLEQMYQQVILDHAKDRLGSGLVDPVATGLATAAGESFQVNTTCGDEVHLRLGIDGDVITSVSWEGAGCSISQASVSVLHDLVQDGTVAQAEELFAAFGEMMRAKGAPLTQEQEDLLEDAAAFVGVGQYPARIKCALLGWMALKDALIQVQKG